MNYHFKVHKEKDGFWAESIELEGCRAQADNLAELEAACEEVLNLYLEEPADSNMDFPLPNESLVANKKTIAAKVDPEIALAVLLRHYRKDRKLTQKQVSEMLGMKNIYSYQRLEKRSNPTLKIMNNIHTIFPDMKIEYIFK